MAEHTPGPWTADLYDGYEDGTDMEVLDKDGFPIATIRGRPILNRWSDRFPEMLHWADGADDGRTQRERLQEEIRANTLLFLAAPDLLAALEGLMASFENYASINRFQEEWDEYDHMMSPRWAAARAAIAKAKGGA